MNSIRNLFLYFTHSVLFVRIFNRANFTKIFLIGFSTRLIINHLFQINVFTEYLHSISLIYYFLFSSVIVLLSELVDYFNINIIPRIPKISIPKVNFATLKTLFEQLGKNSRAFIPDLFLIPGSSDDYVPKCYNATDNSKGFNMHKELDGDNNQGLRRRGKINGLRSQYQTNGSNNRNTNSFTAADKRSSNSQSTNNSVPKDTSKNNNKLPTYRGHKELQNTVRSHIIRKTVDPKINPRFNKAVNSDTVAEVSKNNKASVLDQPVNTVDENNSTTSKRSVVPKIITTNIDTNANELLKPVAYNPNNITSVNDNNNLKPDSSRPVRTSGLTPTTPKTVNLTPITPGTNISKTSGVFTAEIEGETVYLKTVNKSQVFATTSKGVIDPSTNNPVRLPSKGSTSTVNTQVKDVTTMSSKASTNSVDNCSNKATVGMTDPSAEVYNVNTRKLLIERSVNDKIREHNNDAEGLKEVSPTFVTEVDVNKKGILGRLKLGFTFDTAGSKVKDIYIKYHDKSKRMFF